MGVLRAGRTLAIGVLIGGTLAATGFGFVLKSLPYRTPQLVAPAADLATARGAHLAGYPGGIRAVPVLSWPQVNTHAGRRVMSPARFATALAALRHDGFTSVGLATVAALARGERVRLPARPVLLTFDGSVSTDWTTVDPILHKYGFTATVFLNPAQVPAKSPSYFLTAGELADMTASGRWDAGVLLTGRPTPRAASQAGVRLHHLTGRPPLAYAFSVPLTRAAASAQAASATTLARALRPAAVLASPAMGTAGFVLPAAGSVAPRVEILPSGSLSSLAGRLRMGAPAPPPADPLRLPWPAGGGTCRASASGLTVTAHGYGLCTPTANGSQWRNYTLRLRAVIPMGSTAIVDIRATRATRAEIAIARTGIMIEQQATKHWVTLANTRAPRIHGRPRWLPPLRVPVTVTVTGARVSVSAGHRGAHAQLAPRVAAGLIALGVAGAKHATVSYTAIQMSSP